MSDDRRYVLVVSCPDRGGIVAALSTYILEQGGSIEESHHFNDRLDDMFYMRTVFRATDPATPGLEGLRLGFEGIAERFHMTVGLHEASRRPRVMIAVSRIGHCLYDILHRYRTGALAIDIPVVVSNHETMRSFVEWNEIPFVHLPIEPGNKKDQEDRIAALVEELDIDLLVLARYMQVLSPELCELLAGRCINIHHSFLPSFKGAKPYHQAHARGVKIIGATAHYVTSDLDEGPIIEQEVMRVHHACTPEQCVEIGRDVETQVLARAIKWHAEHRIVISGKKTIIFA